MYVHKVGNVIVLEMCEGYLFASELSDVVGEWANRPASCSGGSGFKSRSGDWISSLRIFVAFLSSSRQMLG